MRKLVLICVFSAVVLSNSQSIYFPDDNATEEKFGYNPSGLVKNATEFKRGTEGYQQSIDTIISRGILKLTLAISKSMSSTLYQKDNIVYSPINIAGALALILLGSNGKTFDEISNVLGLATGVDIQSKSQIVHEQLGRIFKKLEHSSSSYDIGDQVNFATAIFVQDDFPIRSIYKETSENIYKSEILNVDFRSNPTQAKNSINAWVSDRTMGKISKLLSDVPPTSTKVIIASALYFKGAWENPFFDSTFTRRRSFYTNGRNSTSTNMVEMMSNGGNFPYYRDHILDAEIIGFPYKGNKTTMYVIMPQHSNKDRLRDLQNRLTPSELLRLVDNMIYRKCAIAFPKMRLESTLDLSSTLMDLGVKSLFNPYEANLGLISPGLQGKLMSQNFQANVIRNPISVNDDNSDEVLIFTRMGAPVNCTQIFDAKSNLTTCQQVDDQTNKQVTYKKFGEKVGRRIARRKRRQAETLDSLRLNLQSVDNPGLYADQVLHKVFMDITETGTEAAASTGVSLSRGGDITSFRGDAPFLYFIMNQETKLVLFWGSVNTPTPSF